MNPQEIKRHTYTGMYGILRKDGHVLLIRKARGPYTGTFDLPGGSPEFGETPEETLRREFSEETGLLIEPVRLLEVLTHRCQYVNDHSELEDFFHIGVVFEVKLLGDDTAKGVPDGEDSLESRWMVEESLSALPLSPFASRMLRTYMHRVREIVNHA